MKTYFQEPLRHRDNLGLSLSSHAEGCSQLHSIDGPVEMGDIETPHVVFGKVPRSRYGQLLRCLHGTVRAVEILWCTSWNGGGVK